MKAIFFLLPLSVIAQEILPDVVVTANRNTEEAKEVPYTLEILTAEDLLENATRTLPQAFLNTPSVLVQQTTTGHGSPYIRGFTGRQNLLLQDGIRLNNSTWRNGPVQYWRTPLTLRPSTDLNSSNHKARFSSVQTPLAAP